MTQEKIIELQKQMAALEKQHTDLEVTVKVWNQKKRELQKQLDEAEQEQLQLRVKAWRLYNDMKTQLELFEH